VTFVIAGDGPLRQSLELLAADLGLTHRVRFLGVRDDIPLVLAALDVFALTSLWEGVPFSILEAMAAARPVVATAVNGVGEVVEHGQTGWLAAPRDVEQLAKYLEALLRDPVTARAMGQAGRRRVEERFSLDGAVARYSALYQRLYRDKRHNGPTAGAPSVRVDHAGREAGQPEARVR
jgi:glycosyltransferase involved in cell wall biosynthesis